MAFDLVVVHNKDKSASDHYLVLRVDYDEWAPYFSIGQNLILSIDNSDKLRLEPSCVSSSGKHSTLRNATFNDSVYLPEDLFTKIIQAKSISFEIEGNRYSKLKELTGTLSEQNLENLRKLPQQTPKARPTDKSQVV